MNSEHKKIKFKLPKGIYVVTECFDESYIKYKLLLYRYYRRIGQLENRMKLKLKINSEDREDEINRLVEKITELSEEQRYRLEDLFMPNICFLAINRASK